MLLPAKVLAPARMPFVPYQSQLEQATQEGLTLFVAPGGCLMREALATVLRASGGEPLWLCVGPEDHDPAILLLSLCLAARRLTPAIGDTSLDLLRSSAGRPIDWPPIFGLWPPS